MVSLCAALRWCRAHLEIVLEPGAGYGGVFVAVVGHDSVRFTGCDGETEIRAGWVDTRRPRVLHLA